MSRSYPNPVAQQLGQTTTRSINWITGAIVVLGLSLVAYGMVEQLRWERYARENKCEKRRVNASNPTLPKVEWVCADGSVHWRTELPGEGE